MCAQFKGFNLVDHSGLVVLPLVVQRLGNELGRCFRPECLSDFLPLILPLPLVLKNRKPK